MNTIKSSQFKVKITIVLAFLLIFGTQVIAQPGSTSSPNHIEWRANADVIFLDTAVKHGIQIPDSLSLIVYFDKNTDIFETGDVPKFEFQWYRYASTKRYFVKSTMGELNKKSRNETMYHSVSSTHDNLRPGWWEVQIVSYNDNGFIQFNNSQKFQILIK